MSSSEICEFAQSAAVNIRNVWRCPPPPLLTFPKSSLINPPVPPINATVQTINLIWKHAYCIYLCNYLFYFSEWNACKVCRLAMELSSRLENGKRFKYDNKENKVRILSYFTLELESYVYLGNFRENNCWTGPPLPSFNFVHGSHMLHMDRIVQVATAPGPLACLSRCARPPSLS